MTHEERLQKVTEGIRTLSDQWGCVIFPQLIEERLIDESGVTRVIIAPSIGYRLLDDWQPQTKEDSK